MTSSKKNKKRNKNGTQAATKLTTRASTSAKPVQPKEATGTPKSLRQLWRWIWKALAFVGSIATFLLPFFTQPEIRPVDIPGNEINLTFTIRNSSDWFPIYNTEVITLPGMGRLSTDSRPTLGELPQSPSAGPCEKLVSSDPATMERLSRNTVKTARNFGRLSAGAEVTHESNSLVSGSTRQVIGVAVRYEIKAFWLVPLARSTCREFQTTWDEDHKMHVLPYM
jgi:hypothetical protein